MKVIIDLPNSLYANRAKIRLGSIASKRILDCVRHGVGIPSRATEEDIITALRGQKICYKGYKDKG